MCLYDSFLFNLIYLSVGIFTPKRGRSLPSKVLLTGSFDRLEAFYPEMHAVNASQKLLPTHILHLPAAVLIFISVRTVNPTAYYQPIRCHNTEDYDITFHFPADLSLNFAANLTMANLYIFSSILK
jgi:hypothetical protein